MYNKVSTGMNFVEREKEVEKFWKDKDALIITTSLNENSPSSSVGFVSSGVQYTDVDKQSFNEKFRLLEESLKEKIDEYEKEQKKTYGNY